MSLLCDTIVQWVDPLRSLTPPLDIDILSTSVIMQRARASKSVDIANFLEGIWLELSIDRPHSSSIELEYTNHVIALESSNNVWVVKRNIIQCLQRHVEHPQAFSDHAHCVQAKDVDLQDAILLSILLVQADDRYPLILDLALVGGTDFRQGTIRHH